LDFDSNNDIVNCGVGPTVDISGTQITLEAWIFPTAWRTSSFEGTIINKESLSSSGYMLRCGNNGQLSFAFGNGTGFPEVQSTTGTLTLNTWQHVAATYDGTTMRIYRNGVQVGSSANTSSIAAATAIPLAIGSSVSYPTRTFAGRIDEVRIWNVARSASELAANQLVQPCPGTTGLRAYYQFDEGVESANNAGVTNLPDASGNGNNGTLANFALTGPTSNWVQGRTGFTACPTCTGAPVAGTIGGSAAGCLGVSNVLTVTGATLGLGITYQWKYRANGSSDPYITLGTSTLQNTSALPLGVWEVVFDVTCSDGPTTVSSAPFVLTVSPVPTATASSNSPVCDGATLNLTGATDIGTSFNWTGPASYTSTDQNATRASMIAAWAGTYSLTATANGCTSAPSTVSVVVSPSPIINSTTATPNPLCNGTNAQLQVNTVPPGYLIGSGGATFIDISASGTSVGTLSDDSGHNVTFPSFTFNGVAYTAGRISANGTFTFAATTAAAPFTNVEFPTTAFGSGNVVLCPFWDDHFPVTGVSQILTQQIGSTFIIQWEEMGSRFITPFGVAGQTVTFQIQLDATTGAIFFAYDDVIFGGTHAGADAGLGATVGIQWAASAGNFAQFSFNTASLTNGQVISFTPGSFIYLWTPNTFLSADNIPNPAVTAPNATTAYSVLVTGSNGCTRTGNVTLTVNQVPDVDLALVDNCPAGQYSLSVLVNSTGSGPTVNLSYTVNGGAPIVVSGLGVGPQTPLGPFQQLDEVVVTIVDPVGSCNTALPLFRSACPEIVTCPNTLVKTYCYVNNDTRSWIFTSSNGIDPIRIDFVSGLMAPGDVIRAFDGIDNTGLPLLSLTGNFPDLTGAFATSNGPSIYIEVESDGSGSCADANPAASSWLFNVRCNPGCTDPNGALTAIPNCTNLNFTVDVDVFDLGGGIDPTTFVDIEYSVNGGQPDTIPGALFGITTIGPFNLGSVVNVRLLHEYDAACNRNLGNVTAPFSLCPNNEPCEARPLTMNPNYTCVSTMPGEMAGSTLTAGITGGCTGVVQDVWYSFVATGSTHRITLGGTTAGLSYSLYSGANCSGPLTLHPGFGCAAGGTVTEYNGLTAGTTYFVRVSRSTTGTNVFTVCVGAPPAGFIGENALDFAGTAAGSDDRVNCGIAPSIDITGNTITVEAWIFPTAWRVSSFQGSIVNKEGPNFNGYTLRCGNNGQLSFNIGTGTTWVERISATGALTLNTWQHVAGVYDGTTMRIYRDGVELTPVTSSGVVGPIASTGPSQQLTIGNWSQDNTRGFVGKIDEVRVWNVAQSQAQLMATMNQELCGGEPGLRAYYQFNQGVDGGNNAGLTTLFDLSPFGNNGTLVNMALNGPTSNWVQGRTGLSECPPCASAPTAGAINGTATVCSNLAHSLSLLNATSGTGISYQWYYGPVGNPTANQLGTALLQSTASIPAGTWELVVEVTCAGFGTVATAPFNFVKTQAPSAVASAGPACVGQDVQLTGTTDIGTGFTWTGPNSFSSALQNPVITAIPSSGGGTYTFTTTANGCTVSSSVAISVVNPPLITGVTANPNPVCLNGSSQLAVTASGVLPNVLISELVLFRTGTGQTPSYPAHITGQDLAELVNASTTPADISGWTIQAFTSNGTAPTHSLTFPSGTVIPANGVAVVHFGSGTDNLPLLYFNTGGGTDTYFSGGPMGVVVRNGSTVVDAVGAGTSFTWDPSTGVTAGNWSGVANSPGGFAGTTRTALTDSNTGADWTASSVAQPQSIGTFNNYNNPFASPIASYAWAPATFLNDATIANPLASGVSVTTAYTVTVTNVTGCSSTGSVTLQANPAITGVSFNTLTPNYCAGGSVALTASPVNGGAPFTYAWTDPNNNPAGADATQVANLPGTWSVTITDNCGGSVSSSVVVTEFPVPVASANSSTPACTGAPINFTATSTVVGSTFAWSGPGGFTSTSQDPTIPSAVLTNSGTYSVVASANGCSSAAASTVVTVSSTPSTPVMVPNTATICEGQSVNLSATSVTSGTGTIGTGTIQNTGTTYPTPYGAWFETMRTQFLLLPADLLAMGAIPGGTLNSIAFTVASVGTAGIHTNFTIRMGNSAATSLTTAGGWQTVPATPVFGPVNYQPVAGVNTHVLTTPFVWTGGSVVVDICHSNDPTGTGGTLFTNNAVVNATATANPSVIWLIADNLEYCLTALAPGSESVNRPNITFGYSSSSAITWSPGTGLNTTTGGTVTASPTSTTIYTATANNAGCTTSNTVTVNVNQLPTTATVGGPQLICANTATTGLGGNTPTVGTGAWSIVGGGTGTFSNASDPNSTFTHTGGAGPIVLRWTITSLAPCAPSSADVTVTLNTLDTDGDGVIDCLDNCPNLFGQIGQACDAGPGFVIGTIDANCVCVGQQCTTDLVLEFQTDANANQISWELRSSGTNILAQSGSGLPGPAIVTATTCLPDGCYYLRVLDAGGDGIANGGYILRTLAGAQRIIDNRNNFTSGSVSAVIGNGGFCLPLGTDRLIFTSCDKLDWVNNQFIVSVENPVVSAQFGVNNANSGYQFWWFDPNGSYGYSKFRSHATSDGFGTGATRACHARINNWSPNQIPTGVLMNVKVRGRVNGSNLPWGPVCRFMIDPVRAECPLTKLMDIPGNQFFSCGVTRPWGSGAASRVVARTVDGATQYQFRFVNAELPAGVVRTTTTPVLQLNWTPALPNGTYQVQVRAFKNGAWCVTSLPWGDVCNVTITGSTGMALEGTGTTSAAELAMFPNPNNGDQLTLSLSAVEEGVNTVSVDIFDLSGARVVAKVIPVNDGMIYQQMAVSELASGVYMVNITAGTKRYTERLVIAK
jgi:hypothetical protein